MPDWRKMCFGVDTITVEGNRVAVGLGGNRHHQVEVHDAGQTYILRSVVARAKVVADIPDIPIRAWLRNRVTPLVGFRIDHRNRLLGEAWLPKAGLSREEFVFCIQRVAAECDRFEYILTGKDSE